MKKTNSDLLPDAKALSALLEGRLRDPHSILGMHKGKNGNVLVRVFDPMADSVAILYGEDDLSYQAMEKVQKDGLFAAEFESGEFFRYQVRKTFPNGTTFTARDPYSFLPEI